MQNENYIVIQGWMRNELNLKGNELMVYALIYGFTQDNDDIFTGTAGYIADWIGTSKQTVFNTLKSLESKGLLEKYSEVRNGVTFCSYKSLIPPKKLDGVLKKLDEGSKKILVNNNIEDIDNYNKDYYKSVVSMYNDICVRLRKKERITMACRKHINARLKDYGINEIQTAFIKANESDFCCGKNDRGWKADFDWLMKNSDNIAKVLDGKYDNKMNELEQAYMEIEEEKNNGKEYSYDCF